jgi:hypothetical protein
MRRAAYATGVEIGIELPVDAFAGTNSREERP